MKKLLTVITALILALSSLMAGAFAAEYDDNDVVLVAITNDGIIVSEPTDISSNGDYTFTLSDLNIDTAAGIPTVYIKDGIRHSTDGISGYFTGAKAPAQFPLIPVLIGIAVAAAVAIVVILLIPTKKKN